MDNSSELFANQHILKFNCRAIYNQKYLLGKNT